MWSVLLIFGTAIVGVVIGVIGTLIYLVIRFSDRN